MKIHIRYVMAVGIVLIAALAVPAQQRDGTIRGKVKEQKGKSLAEVTIRATHADDKEKTFETTSNAKGEFTLSGLPGGEYILSFEKKGYKTFTTRKVEVTSGETLKLRSTIEIVPDSPPYSLIRGAVLYGVGYTLPNALVEIERIGDGKAFKQQTISHEGGEFAFRLRAEKATYRITATARGFKTSSIEIEVDPDEVRNIAITLQPDK